MSEDKRPPYNDPEESIGFERLYKYNEQIISRLSDHYRDIIECVGEDPEREGLKKTPERVSRAMQFLTHGYDLDPASILRSAMFQEDYKQMVLVKDIELYSLCEHHMLPFFGKAHVAYIPNGHIVGLSKIPRVVARAVRRRRAQMRGNGGNYGRLDPLARPVLSSSDVVGIVG